MAQWYGMHLVGFGVVFPLFSCWNNEQEEFSRVCFKKKQNLSVIDKADPVKSQIRILELTVLS